MAPSEHEFIAADEMTYLAFFAGDERGGRPYETWSGSLGMNPSPASVLRVDSGKATDVTQQVPAPGLHGHAPHFSTSVGKAGVIPTRRQ
jgi:hypothetical protein